MQEIQNIIAGYNSEKEYIIKAIIEMKDYNSYSKEKVKDLKERRDKIDGFLSDITNNILPKPTIIYAPK